MTDQRPTEETTVTDIPEPTAWSPTSQTVGQPNGGRNLLAKKDETVPSTFAEAMAQFAPLGEAEIIGSLYPVVDKELMLKKPFFIVDYTWNTDEKTGNEFVSLHVITKEDERWCINDGGTGIYNQMKQWEHDMGDRKQGIMAPNGLRKSEYTAKWKEVDKNTGELLDKTGPATTYYIA